MKQHLLVFLLFTLVFAYSYSQDTPQKNDDKTPPPSIATTKKYIPKYELGQGSISMGLGVIVPLFYQKFTGQYIPDTRLTVGGNIWFEWDIFLWKGLSTGMEIAGMFALTPNSNTLFMAPITIHLKYTFQVYPIEFPISLGIGMNIASLKNNVKIDFALKPKVGITYRINQNWSTGLFIAYWLIVQSYDYSPNLGKEYSRMGNFIDVSAGFTYVF